MKPRNGLIQTVANRLMEACAQREKKIKKGYLYIDGELIAETTAGYVYAANPYFLIGARTNNSGSDLDDVEYFKGMITQIAIYESALSKDDIKKISSQGMAVSASGKLGTLWGQLT